jgi:C4-dicarboxylate-specific signal transduction histidine kinase
LPYFSKVGSGQGLGLNISKRIAEKLGGTLRLKKQRNPIGSDFELSLPLKKPIYGIQQVYGF